MAVYSTKKEVILMTLFIQAIECRIILSKQQFTIYKIHQINIIKNVFEDQYIKHIYPTKFGTCNLYADFPTVEKANEVYTKLMHTIKRLGMRALITPAPKTAFSINANGTILLRGNIKTGIRPTHIIIDDLMKDN